MLEGLRIGGEFVVLAAGGGLMRSIEDKIEIPESRKDDFRREIMNYIGALAGVAGLGPVIE